MTLSAEPPSARALDEETRAAAVTAVEAAKARGWTQPELRAWFESKGVPLSDYLAAKRGEAVGDDVRSVLVTISIAGLPDRPVSAGADDPFPELPAAMKAAKRWLLWRLEPHDDPTKKPRKVPLYASGERRYGALDSLEDVARLVTYTEACAALTDAHAGLGFALGPDGDVHPETGAVQCWQGIDLDNLDQHPGLQFVADDLPGYTEKSPSGTGVHAIGYGRAFVALGANATGIEAYARGRFFTVTGESVGMGEVTDLYDFVEGRLAPLHGHRPQDTSSPEGGTVGGSLSGALAAADLRSALASMRSDDRDLWVRMGLALKALGDQGRGLWLEWSQTSAKYDAADAARSWDSFRPERTGYQAVFAEAQRGGWVNPARGGAREPEDDEAEPADEIESEPFRASELSGEPPERQWIVAQWIVEGAVNSLYGDGGVGKTLLAQQLACAVSMGSAWLGLPTKQGAVLAILCEDEKDELHRRHNYIKAASGHTIGNPFSDVWLWPRVGDDNVMVKWNRDGEAVLGRLYEKVVAAVERVEPALLILDTLADIYGGNEIDRPQVNYFVKTVLGGLIKRRSQAGKPLTVLLLGHPSVAGKATGSGFSGSTAWNNAVRSRMYLTKPDDGPGDERILTRGKANYASSGDETAVRLFFADGVLHAQEDAEDGDSIVWAAKRDIVSMVDRAWAAGEPYTAQKTHRRYIYTALVAEMGRGGFGPQTVRQALRELIVDDGKISVAKSHDKRGFRSANSGK